MLLFGQGILSTLLSLPYMSGLPQAPDCSVQPKAPKGRMSRLWCTESVTKRSHDRVRPLCEGPEARLSQNRRE